jgi:hypothetical protein
MADRNALRAEPGGTDLHVFPLSEPEILVDVAFSFFGDSGEAITVRLPAAIEDDLLAFVAARTQAASADTPGEKKTPSLAAMYGFATPSDDDAHPQVVGSVPSMLPTVEQAEHAHPPRWYSIRRIP